MFRHTLAIVALLALTFASCDDNAANSTPPEASDNAVESEVPASFAEALDALDAMASKEDREAYRNDQVDMGLVHRQVGMQLRNNWGLRSGSKLKDYFSERGIANADWISSAIFEGWIARLKTGSFNEDAIIAKYAKIEKDWRAWSENPDSYEQPEDGAPDPFAEDPAEQGNVGQAAPPIDPRPEDDDKPQPKPEERPR